MSSANLSQQEIEELMAQMNSQEAVPSAAENQAASPSEAATPPPEPGETAGSSPDSLGAFAIEDVEFPELTPQPIGDKEKDLDFFCDVGVKLSLELGRTSLTVREILQLEEGSIIRLNSAAGDNATLRINSRQFAAAEVVVINEDIACRVVDFKLNAISLKEED